ncbi:MAG: hypothetical protein QOF14_4295 [Hyphomicrobiales bacterium]|jgi:hypothetical protein|nr:hypothetical protein [Hyphomicrobiales bacterium]
MRTIDIFVRDRNGRPLYQADIAFSVDGAYAGEVANSEGRGRIELPDRESVIEVTATYDGVPQHEKLAQDQDDFTFKFDVDPAPPIPPPAPPLKAHPDLIDALIIILIAGAVDIFLFAMAAQFISSPVFQKLPSFITDAYTAIWSSIVAGGAGIGGAIVKAFTRKANVQAPNYLVYVLATAILGLIAILLLAVVALRIAPSGASLQIPPGVHRLNPKSNDGREQTFDLERPAASSGPAVVTYVLKGKISLKEGKVSGRLENGIFRTGENFAPLGPVRITRLEFSTCYIRRIASNDQIDSYPPPKSANAQDLDIVLERNKTYTLPPMDFSFELPADSDSDKMWLCAAIRQDTGAYWPAI